MVDIIHGFRCFCKWKCAAADFAEAGNGGFNTEPAFSAEGYEARAESAEEGRGEPQMTGDRAQV